LKLLDDFQELFCGNKTRTVLFVEIGIIIYIIAVNLDMEFF